MKLEIKRGEKMPIPPHMREHIREVTHEELAELIDRKFRDVEKILEGIERKIR